MVNGVPPSGSGSDSSKKVDTSSGVPTTGQLHYDQKTIAMIKKEWQPLFPDYELTDYQAQQMNDAFLKNVGDSINSVMQWALKQQKERDQQEKEDRGG